MNKPKLTFVLVTLIALGGCSDKTDDAVTSSAGKEATVKAEGAEVSLMDGKVTLRLPSGFEDKVSQEGLVMYAKGQDQAVTMVEGQAPPGFANASAVMDQTVANLEKQDPQTRVLNRGDRTWGSQSGHVAHIQSKSNGLEVHMVTAILLSGDKLTSIQVTGKQSDAAEINEISEAIFGSMQIK